MLEQSGNSRNRAETEKGVLIDTNIMHSIGLYYEALKEHTWPEEHRSISTKKPKDFRRVVSRLRQDYSDEELSGAVIQGMGAISLIRDEGLRPISCAIVDIEMLRVLARGQAIVSAARRGLQPRMWTRTNDYWVDSHLEQGDWEQLGKRYTIIIEGMEWHGITRIEELSGGSRGMLAVASALARIVYMETVDTLIYATAISEKAGQLITRDGILRGIANAFRNPSGEEQNRMREEFEREYKEENVKYPLAFCIGTNGQPQPDPRTEPGANVGSSFRKKS